MATKVVNLRDFAKELGDFTEAHIDEMREATARGVAASIPYLVEISPIDTGLYAQSWDFSVDEMSVFLGNYAPHSPIIEYGARPFTPPIKPLLEWAKRVLQDSSQHPKYSDKVWALARGTQRKIAEHGIQPRAVMEKAIPTIIENIKREFDHIYK